MNSGRIVSRLLSGQQPDGGFGVSGIRRVNVTDQGRTAANEFATLSVVRILADSMQAAGRTMPVAQ